MGKLKSSSQSPIPHPHHALSLLAASPLPYLSLLSRYESSSEDSSTAENFSDNESTENEAPEPEERVPSVATAPLLRPPGTAAANPSRQECQLSRECQRVPAAAGASPSNEEEEIRSVSWMAGIQAGGCGGCKSASDPRIQGF